MHCKEACLVYFTSFYFTQPLSLIAASDVSNLFCRFITEIRNDAQHIEND